jgi:hypothetical protein
MKGDAHVSTNHKDGGGHNDDYCTTKGMQKGTTKREKAAFFSQEK